MRAVEFFAGIGGFAAAAESCGVEVVAAFDQNAEGNSVYAANFGRSPNPRNLARIPAEEIPDSDLWWMSPPCTPFTVRGNRRDDDDPRAAPLLRLIGSLGEVRPGRVILENVRGFATSRSRDRLLAALVAAEYDVAEVDLDPTDFGVPMRRPRRFVLARRGVPAGSVARRLAETSAGGVSAPGTRRTAAGASPSASSRTGEAGGGAAPIPLVPLRHFVDLGSPEALDLPLEVIREYAAALDVVDPAGESAVVSCVTRAYARSLTKSGSFLRRPDGRVRRLSPEELLRLFGFPERFRFPEGMPLRTRWRLVGNSVDVRAAAALIAAIA